MPIPSLRLLPRVVLPAAFAAALLAPGVAPAQSTDKKALPPAEQPVIAGSFVADGKPGTFAHEFARRLYHVSLSDARDHAKASIAKEGQVAQFAHGVTLFLGAVEGLVSDLTRYGLMNYDGADLPFLRLPVPPNTTPDNIDYDKFRKMLQRFVDGLAEARTVLDKVSDNGVQLPLRLSLVRIDVNGDGKYVEYERLGPFIMSALAGGRGRQDDWAAYEKDSKDYMAALAAGDADALVRLRSLDPVFGFDAADAIWLRGYTHLLSAIAETLLAHDLQASFDASFHVFFPQAGLPGTELASRTTTNGRSFFGSAREIGQAMDVFAFLLHSPWKPTEPERLKAVRGHLKAMVSLSRETWKSIRAETDNTTKDNVGIPEWIPGPHQAQSGTMRVDDRIVDGWHRFLDTFDKVLDGKLLVGHWRFNQGMNLKKILEEPRPFSPFLMIQGSHALPYLEDGPLADGNHMSAILRIFRGNFLTYFIWFN